jgi:probable rRNA maturation factor
VIDVEVNNRQRILAPLDSSRLVEAARRILSEAGYTRGEVSLAIVADDEMQQLNARWLEHDWPTDVLSFVLEQAGDALEGEIIVSVETAQRQAAAFSWRAEDELLLYVIHGALHLVGHDDRSDEDQAAMRAAEAKHLARFGLAPPTRPLS